MLCPPVLSSGSVPHTVPHTVPHAVPRPDPQDILNHVFDDVESFVSKLQKSAEAARVLEHRERGRRTRRRAAGGERLPRGILNIQSLPNILALPRVPPHTPLPALTPHPWGPHWASVCLTGAVSVSPTLHLRPLPAEGLLTLRAKPPSEAEYTDVLQKIKYAFSLLVRMRGVRPAWGGGVASLTRLPCTQ